MLNNDTEKKKRKCGKRYQEQSIISTSSKLVSCRPVFIAHIPITMCLCNSCSKAELSLKCLSLDQPWTTLHSRPFFSSRINNCKDLRAGRNGCQRSLDCKKYGFLQKCHFNKLCVYKEMFRE